MMLSTSVLCMKKKKKRTYSLAGDRKNGKGVDRKSRCDSGSTMLHVTEDTPPDMLAGAMDLAVHLPAGRSVKMSVERSTPMMDLLVQITTSQQLQLSNYTLQALGMAPSAEQGDKVLPYKPNTPIGTLDTQHIRVVPKSRSAMAATREAAPGHQPFESTFRLKVHLPRNQLYVTRVSRNIFLEDIMKKVCEEKNLDPHKYEFKHPVNLDEILDPKLTLSDYQITEIYVVARGTASLSQAFSSSDIMALRKEEERKQMHHKTGGGVFNLIFRRGKSSTGSGSISSDTRSISPTHSDDSRSVTPPGIPAPPKTAPPKPPARKRRPAPKPPKASDDCRRTAEGGEQAQARRSDNGLVICHSRNSSDSSGYHEASVLSENCNASLPRRPKSAFVDDRGQHGRGGTNLGKMAAQSKSTTSLGMTGRRKKAAPPPPPAVRASNPSINLGTPSPVVASQPPPPTEAPSLALSSKPVPLPRGKSKAPQAPASETSANYTPAEPNTLNREEKPVEEPPTEPVEEAPTEKPLAKPKFDTFGKRRLHKLSSLTASFEETSGTVSMVDDLSDLDDSVFSRSASRNARARNVFDELYGMHGLEEAELPKNQSSSSLRSLPGFVSGGMRKWNNLEELDSESLASMGPGSGSGWVVGDSETVSLAPTSLPSISSIDILPDAASKPFGSTDSGIAPEKPEEDVFRVSTPPPPVLDLEEKPVEEEDQLDWQYQLPSPPKAFRDSSPPASEDSVVTSPELFEKLKTLEERQLESVQEPPLLTTLSLEHLEKRSSLVYRRELTRLKMPEEEAPRAPPALPNFRISTYDKPKTRIRVFEDDTVRSSGGVVEGGGAVGKVESGVSRSESLSKGNGRGVAKPVSRSKSHLAVVARSSSFYDVSSGLQSLGVMRLIQDKLNTPTTPQENPTPPQKPALPSPPPPKTPPPTAPKPPKPSGPPAVNMTTWSDRPKAPVSVADDKIATWCDVVPVEATPKTVDHQRFIGHTTPAGYRKPFHSVANRRPQDLGEASRVPVVRAVELKKGLREAGGPVVRGFQASRASWGGVRPAGRPDSVPVAPPLGKSGGGKPAGDSREELLDAIRSFGGKKGLRSVKS